MSKSTVSSEKISSARSFSSLPGARGRLLKADGAHERQDHGAGQVVEHVRPAPPPPLFDRFARARSAWGRLVGGAQLVTCVKGSSWKYLYFVH